MEDLTTGADNTAMGWASQLNITTGQRNTSIGANTLVDLTDADDCTAVGMNALNNATGQNNTALGKSAGLNISTGTNNICLGKDAGITGSPGGNQTTGSNAIFLGDENIGEANIQVSWTVASDKRDKTDVEPLKTGLDFINKLDTKKVRSRNLKKYSDDLSVTPNGKHKEDWLDTGFLAQDVEKLEEEYGYKIEDETNLTTTLSSDGGMYGLTYSKFIPSLVKAVQELSTEVEQLKSKIEE